MRKLLISVFAALGLVLAACGEDPTPYEFKPNTPNAEESDNPSNPNNPSNPDNPSQGIEQITIADFLKKADPNTIYQLTGVVNNLVNTIYGNFDLVDQTGTIYIYGLLNKAGEAKAFADLSVQVGDTLTLQGSYAEYNGQAEIKNAQYINHSKGVNQNETSTYVTYPDDRLRIEMPKLLDGNLFVNHSVSDDAGEVMNYCLEYDPVQHHSRWVAFRFDAVTRMQNVGRSDEPFMDDPAIPSQYHIGYSSFGQSYVDVDGNTQQLPRDKFDRGHLCASADRYLNREANEQTFYMSNMSPQISNFNSPYWSSFESYVQKRGRDGAFADTLYVVKGGTIAKDQILGHVKRGNGALVTIPKYYFMALLRYKAGAYSALAFWMEHKDYELASSLSNREMGEKVVTIDELEQLTGIDFFHNLPDDVETAVESTVNKGEWGF